MSNHLHLVVRMRPEWAKKLSDAEVIDRWLMVYPGFHEEKPLDGALGHVAPEPRKGQREKLLADPDAIACCRQRLGDLSWFMRAISEPIARWANREDEVTGRFWEGRFHVNPILDLEALLATMVYVDLNPIRAGIAISPETSAFTSGQQRTRALVAAANDHRKPPGDLTPDLLRPRLAWIEPIAAITARDEATGSGGWRESDYLQLLDKTGRALHREKHGHIDPSLPSILSRLNLDSDRWVDHMQRSTALHGVLGRPERRQAEAARRGSRWVRTCTSLFEADRSKYSSMPL